MDEPEKKNGHDPRLTPVIRVVVELKMTPEGEQTSINGNAPPDVCVHALSQAIVAAARIGWKKAEETLLVTAKAAPPPLRRIP